MNTDHMDSDAKKIGDALDAAMSAYGGGKGIKQTHLANLSGVPQGTISRTLSGKSVPETKTLAKLAAALGSETFSKTLSAILPSPNASPTPQLPAVTQIKPATERDTWTSELVALASQLDTLHLGMLIKTARDLVAEQPAKQMPRSTG